MTQEFKSDGFGESPARRLGVLYVASFSVIVGISAFNQVLILRELAWHSATTSAVSRFARDQSLGRPLSLAALALLAADSPDARSELEKSLRNAILESRQNASGSAPPGDPHFRARSGLGPRCSQLLQQAETHRLAATRSAETLLSLFVRQRSSPPGRAESNQHVGRIIDEEEAGSRAMAEAAQASAAEAAGHVDRLNTFELLLFGLVLLVLVLEGLFVVNPAVLRIQRFMADLRRSHADLKAYSAKLERSNSELQDFASVASHDLQEPLRKVQAFSDRLRSRCAGTIDDQGRDYLDRIQNAAARMQTLINDLLTYCRVATKVQPFVPTDLVSITREVVSDLEARIEQVNGQVLVGELPTVDADPLQVRQLMQNLIGNSLKYWRPEVAPVVKVWSKHLPHHPSSEAGDPPRPFCQILIEDNGIGFDPVYSERIFTIFQRLHGRNEYEGTGVGLAVCRKIVERHGGTITARSTPGNGSTFLVSLPIHQPKEKTHDDCES
jgi:signal transduction histidine kinase